MPEPSPGDLDDAMLVPVSLLAVVALGSSDAGPRESIEVLRAQIQIATCNVSGAGTTDPVSAYIGGDRPTWLDYPGSDLERGRTYRYDLVLDGIRTLADLTTLELRATGDDDLCVRELVLIVNGTTIFSRLLGSGRWLRGAEPARSPTLTISGGELRANGYWQRYSWSLSHWLASTGATLPRAEIIDRLQSYVATAMHDSGLAWGASPDVPVTIRPKNETTIRADLELRLVVDFWIDPDVHVSFELAFCEDDQLRPSIKNVAVAADSGWLARVLGTGLLEHRRRDSAVRLVQRLQGLHPAIVVGALCPHVNADASLSF